MIHKALYLLTILAVSLHAVWGCCAHHQHCYHSGEEQHSGNTHVHLDHSNATCGHTEHHASKVGENSQDSGEPCDHRHKCHEAVCQFIGIQIVARPEVVGSSPATCQIDIPDDAMDSQISTRAHSSLLDVLPHRPLQITQRVWLL